MLAVSKHGARRKEPVPKRISTLSKEISNLLSRHRYGEAVKCCDMILAIDPNNTKVLEEREFALIRDRQYTELISVCRRTLKDRSDNVDALSDMGLGLIMTENILEGDKVLDQALSLNPGHIPTLWRKAMACSHMKKYKPAIVWLDRALDIRPNNSLAYKRKGDALSNLGMYDKALSFYDKSLDIRPDSPATLKGKAHTLHRLGKSNESLACYRNAWETDPKDRGVFLKMIRLMLETKQYEDVILHCDYVLNNQPDNTDMLLMKRIALSKLGRHEIVDYREAILDVSPWNMDVLWADGAGSQLSGYDDVSKYCDAILKEEPWNINVLWKKGVALSRLGNVSGVASGGQTVSISSTNRGKSCAFGPEANQRRECAWPTLMLDTNVLYECCTPNNKNHKKTLRLCRSYLSTHVCYVEYTVIKEIQKLLQKAPDHDMWKRMQTEMVRSFRPDKSAFPQLVSRYSKVRKCQLQDVRQFYADMLNHTEMQDTIVRWSDTKKNNPVVKEKGAQALLKNYPDNNILAFAAFCAREADAVTILLTRDSDFLYFAKRIRSKFGVKAVCP